MAPLSTGGQRRASPPAPARAPLRPAAEIPEALGNNPAGTQSKHPLRATIQTNFHNATPARDHRALTSPNSVETGRRGQPFQHAVADGCGSREPILSADSALVDELEAGQRGLGILQHLPQGFIFVNLRPSQYDSVWIGRKPVPVEDIAPPSVRYRDPRRIGRGSGDKALGAAMNLGIILRGVESPGWCLMSVPFRGAPLRTQIVESPAK